MLTFIISFQSVSINLNFTDKKKLEANTQIRLYINAMMSFLCWFLIIHKMCGKLTFWFVEFKKNKLSPDYKSSFFSP